MGRRRAQGLEHEPQPPETGEGERRAARSSNEPAERDQPEERERRDGPGIESTFEPARHRVARAAPLDHAAQPGRREPGDERAQVIVEQRVQLSPQGAHHDRAEWNEEHRGTRRHVEHE